MKIFEKEIKTQLMVYLEINDLITIDQSAYRQQHNTQTALHRVIDEWLCIISYGNLTAVYSFDITTCFDTINHSIVLKKMEYYKYNFNRCPTRVCVWPFVIPYLRKRYKSACSLRSV